MMAVVTDGDGAGGLGPEEEVVTDGDGAEGLGPDEEEATLDGRGEGECVEGGRREGRVEVRRR